MAGPYGRVGPVHLDAKALMAFLVIASQTIPVEVGGPVGPRVEIGQRGRAFDGSARSSVRARKGEWSIVTVFMTTAAANTVVTALEGTPPLAASGDLTGSIDVLVGDIQREHRGVGKVRLSFLVHEA